VRWILFAAGVLALACVAQQRIELGFTTSVSPRLVEAHARRFGAPSRKRIDEWKAYAVKRRAGSAPEMDILAEVNRTLNRVAFVEDSKHWGAEDYWATPSESIASNGADCEDFTIAKYFMLKELGVPISRLRMTYVKSLKLNQAHMVLAYYPRPESDPLVLDNLEDTVRPASQRSDLVPVYSFNDEEVWIEARGRSGSPRQIRNWAALIERLEREART
jgi:predicted transglutaminase-like cysteine proteinase